MCVRERTHRAKKRERFIYFVQPRHISLKRPTEKKKHSASSKHSRFEVIVPFNRFFLLLLLIFFFTCAHVGFVVNTYKLLWYFFYFFQKAFDMFLSAFCFDTIHTHTRAYINKRFIRSEAERENDVRESKIRKNTLRFNHTKI